MNLHHIDYGRVKGAFVVVRVVTVCEPVVVPRLRVAPDIANLGALYLDLFSGTFPCLFDPAKTHILFQNEEFQRA